MRLLQAHRTWITSVLAGACLAMPGPSAAQPRPLELALKAAFMTKFAAFVTWPTEVKPANGAITLCVSGDDPFGPALDQAATAAGERRLVVRRLPVAALDAQCDILYLAGSKAQSVADGLAAMQGAPVLTVTDADRGPARGMIHFVVFQDRIRFHIDAGQISRGGLSLSSKLMALALSVKR